MQDGRPYQRYIDSGHFRVVEVAIPVGEDTKVHVKPLVNPAKGVDFIRSHLKEAA